MKKIFFLLLVLLACNEEPQINGSITDGANARTMVQCNNGYAWLIGMNTLTTVTPHVYWVWQLRYFTYDPNPLSSDGVVTKYITLKFENVASATFKFSLKNGSTWNTLTPGQSITRTLPLPYCDASGNQLKNVDVQRLSCGLLGLRVTMISAGSPHTVYGGTNGPGDLVDTWQECNL